ncbi:MAG: bifunctional heptose 7-phosphate kinase/heptose 1-phosphate adenyltransferase [Cyclobacteriaceae bacterium]
MSSAEKIIAGFSNLKVLIIGDVMIDSYLWGKTSRISPEAPVPVIDVEKREKRLGGAANVALNIKALGAEPILCSVVGKSGNGDEFLNLLSAQQLRSDGILQSEERKTTVKHRIIASSQQLLRVDEESTNDISESEYLSLISNITHMLHEVDVVIFEDYDKGCITPQLIEQTVKKANELSIPTVVDPKKKNFLHYKGVTLFKPNLKEITEGLNIVIDPTSKESIDGANKELKDTLGHEHTLITLSEHGVYFSSDNKSMTIPAHLRKIADVSGAGDTVVSVAALCLASGVEHATIAEISNLAGGLVCEYLGVKSIEKERLQQEIESNQLL